RTGPEPCARRRVGVRMGRLDGRGAGMSRLLGFEGEEEENAGRNGRGRRLEEILFFYGAVDVSQVIAKCVTGVGRSLLEVTGEVQLCAQRAASLNCFCLLPLPLPNVPGGCK